MSLRSPAFLLATLLATLLSLPGCPPAADDDDDSVGDDDDAVGDDDDTSVAMDEEVVRFTTEDGVELEADYLGRCGGAPAVVLFHMIPPGNTRTNFPANVRERLHDLGAIILNVDRRGAGGSGGVARDAYEGPGGGLDVAASVAWLLSEDRECPADPDNIVLIGASNGTTSTMDYASDHPSELPDVRGLIWMSPGGYTENQHSLAENSDVVDALDILFMCPTNESYCQNTGAPGPDNWRVEVLGSAHGARMFDGGALEDQAFGLIEAFLGDVLD